MNWNELFEKYYHKTEENFYKHIRHDNIKSYINHDTYFVNDDIKVSIKHKILKVELENVKIITYFKVTKPSESTLRHYVQCVYFDDSDECEQFLFDYHTDKSFNLDNLEVVVVEQSDGGNGT